MKLRAGIMLDDYKLPVFRKALTDAGYEYKDGGAPKPGLTLLTVQFTDQEALRRVIEDAADECKRRGKPKQ